MNIVASVATGHNETYDIMSAVEWHIVFCNLKGVSLERVQEMFENGYLYRKIDK